MKDRELYTIGEAAEATGLSVKAIRHYEEVDLIPRPRRRRLWLPRCDSRPTPQAYRRSGQAPQEPTEKGPGPWVAMNRLIWSALRRWLYLRRGRMPPARLDGPVWYFAFGSNMNERLFRERRHMTPIETRIARLDGYRLRFAVAGRRRPGLAARFVELIQGIDQVAAGGRKPGVSAPADIVAAPGEHVWGVLYLLPLRKFVQLDASEGRQYAYLWVDVGDQDGRTVHALTYYVPYPAPEGRPSRGYLELIRSASHERGLPEDYIAFLDSVEPRP